MKYLMPEMVSSHHVGEHKGRESEARAALGSTLLIDFPLCRMEAVEPLATHRPVSNLFRSRGLKRLLTGLWVAKGCKKSPHQWSSNRGGD